MVVCERDVCDGTARVLTACDFVDVDSVITANKQVVGDGDLVDRSPKIVEHERRGLPLLIDNRVVLDRQIGKAAVGLNAVQMRASGAAHAVNVVVLNNRIVT